MRPLESLLLLMDLLAFVFLTVGGRHWVRTSQVIVLVALAIATAQWLTEGPRWQMLPAYGLTALFLLACSLPNAAPFGEISRWKRRLQIRKVAAVALGTIGLAMAAALPMMVPVFRFAHPSGPYAIGTLTYQWTDASRAEALAGDPNERRQLMAQVWYPAQANPSAERAAYMTEAETVTASLARLQDMPAFLFEHLKYVSTNAMSSVAATVDQQRYPVLLFLEGATGFRQMNTFQVEHLVSHGYVVVAIDQPGAAAAVVFPDGHHAAGLTVSQFQTMVRPSYMPVGTDSTRKNVLLPNGSTLPSDSIIPYLAQDVSFALDQLAALNQSDSHGRLAGKLDLQRVGVFGVSLGGIVAGEACRLDSRLRACLVMDAPMSIDVVQAGLKQPSMWITRDVASMRLERARAGGWPETEIEAHQSSMRAVYKGLSGAGYFVGVPGMFHGNLTDVASWTPLAPWLGLSGPVGAQRAHDIINAYSLGFFDRHLTGRPAQLLDGVAQPYPEVQFESRRP